MRKKLQEVIDGIVNRSSQIQAIFLFNPRNGLMLMTSAKRGHHIDFELFVRDLSKLKAKEALSQLGFGELESGIFRLSKATMALHFLEKGFSETLILGFVCMDYCGLYEGPRYFLELEEPLLAEFGNHS